MKNITCFVLSFVLIVSFALPSIASDFVRKISQQPELAKDRPSDEMPYPRSPVIRAYTCFACHAPNGSKGPGVTAEKMELLRFLWKTYESGTVSQEYDNEQWKTEMKITMDRGCEEHSLGNYSLTFMFGGCCLPCPNCGVIGFYSPRQVGEGDNITRKYRACKFCGLWQETEGALYNSIGGKPWRCKMVLCDKCPLYDWRYPLLTDFGVCAKCGSTDLKEAKWPSDDPGHIFHRVRRLISRTHDAHMRKMLKQMKRSH